ncbi:Sec-independent protein translocase protein TatB [Roseomonas sp. GC11]|uniref:Sec-independent protein translocase protein TatB n=1 Tax=Roseomonas sp. GC11 TaxID=2950546 RepID=UPI00272E8E3C|nr:Sec-independent protein translocase protein TatB [Roseomonas sp. GC11]
MFDLAWSEIALIAVVAVVVIGPKDLPDAIRNVAKGVQKLRRMASEFQTQADELVREAKLEDVRDQIRDIRNFDVKGTIERHLDKDGEIRRTFNDDPLRDAWKPEDTAASSATSAVNPAAEPVASPVAAAGAPPLAPPVAPAFVPPDLAVALAPPAPPPAPVAEPLPPPPPAFVPPGVAETGKAEPAKSAEPPATAAPAATPSAPLPATPPATPIV